VALRLEAEVNVVVTAMPFHSTVAPLAKSLPETTRERGPEPAVAEAGETDEMDGIPFCAGGVGGVEDPPPPHPIINPHAMTTTNAAFRSKPIILSEKAFSRKKRMARRASTRKDHPEARS
jgi:hypothetical protein